MATWLKHYNPDQIAKKIKEFSSINPNGKIVFQGFRHWEIAVVLESMISIDKRIPHQERRRIIHQTTFNVAKLNKIKKEDVIKEVTRLEGIYKARSKRKYKLFTSISIEPAVLLNSINIDSSRLSFPKKNPHLNNRQVEIEIKRTKDQLLLPPPKNYRIVAIRIEAKSDSEAVDKALGEINLIRSIWNLYWNFQQHLRLSNRKKIQVNKIALGPIHTLFDETGSLAKEGVWFEPDYRGPAELLNLNSEQLKKMNTFLQKVRNYLKGSNYKDDIKTALIRYCCALDLKDLDTSFLRLWGVLEQLTHTHDYKIAIRRASFLWPDLEYHKQFLLHLRDYRNRAVHTDPENHDIEIYVFQLKRYVEALIEFHLINKMGFESLADSIKLLDMPGDLDELEFEKKLYRFAKKIRLSG